MAPLARRTRWAVAAMLAAGLALHLAGALGRSLNTDEVYYPLAAREGRLWDAVRADVHPLLEPLLVGAMVRAGLPENAWRVVSILAWLGVALLAFRLGRRAGGDAMGLAAMALILTSPQGALLSRLVRSYALAAFFGAWSIERFLALIEQPNRRRAALLVIAAALGCYTFYYNLFLLVAFTLAALAWLRRDRIAGRAALISTFVATALFAPWLLMLAGQIAASLGGGWITWDFSLPQIVRRFTQTLFFAGGLDGIERSIASHVPSLTGEFTTLIALPLLVWGAWYLVREDERDRGARRLLAFIPVTFTLLALGAHYLFGEFIAVHYFVVVAAAAAPLLAAPFAFSRRRFVAGLAFGAVMAANLAFFPAATREGNEPLREAAHWIDARLTDRDLVLGVAWFAVDGYRWYGAGRRAIGVPLDLRASASKQRVQLGVMEAADLLALHRALSSPRQVALLLSHAKWRDADRGVALTTQTLRELGFVLVGEERWPFGVDNPSVRAQIWRR